MTDPGAATGASEELLVEVAGGVATLTLNRPDKRNALNAPLVAALKTALAEAATDAAVRVVLIRGAGKDFCSGADLADLARIAEMGAEESLRDAANLGELFVAMRQHPRPLVAAVHGKALAGGCGLATACDLVLASESAQFGYPEVHLGFVPAMVMAILRRKVGEGHAFELAARGHRVRASEALSLGLVQRVFEDAAFSDEVSAYVGDLASRPVSATELTKRLLYGIDQMGFEAAIDRGAEVNAVARLTEACRAGVRAFLERSRSGGKG